MPLIQPEPKMSTERRNFRLRKDMLDKISAYGQMINSSADYVVSAGLDDFFNRDRDFNKFLAEHPDLISNLAVSGKKGRGRPTKLKSVDALASDSAA